MIKLILIISTICVLRSTCLTINNSKYTIKQSVDSGVARTVVYREGDPSTWLARSVYNNSYLKIGWDVIHIETDPGADDAEQALLAGYVEGVQSHTAIYDYYWNSKRRDLTAEMRRNIQKYLDTNTKWVKGMIKLHAASDSYWQMVNLFYQQMRGIETGYNHAAPPEQKLTFNDILWMNFDTDIGDIKDSFKKENNKGAGHCSALIKLLKENSDILVSHNTWNDYKNMNRMIKRYTLPYKNVTATSVSFSGYPGVLISFDDFHILSSGLVSLETTNNVFNSSLWSYNKPTDQVLEAVRVAVANKLADGGQSWTKIFSQFNSGTYNNQWMIVDMNKFTPGSVKPGLLWVAEQMPGFVRREDKTDVLTEQGYWASYNIPYYPDVFEKMGYSQRVKKFGDLYSHDKTSRALIFKRDQGKVVDLDSMMRLMRSNDFKHDPLSRCNCTPPYSAFAAIAARGDLNPNNVTCFFPVMEHTADGAIDAKVTSYELSKTLRMMAVSGPSTGTNLPPFQWSKSDFDKTVPHRGQPDLFNFQPVLISWPKLN